MNTLTLADELEDQDFGSREPQPIAAVMSAVLARYGLPGAPQLVERVGYRVSYPIQRAAELAVA